MKKYNCYKKLTGIVMAGIILVSFLCIQGLAEASNENHSLNAAFGKYGKVSPEDILYQEDFEDGDITVQDPGLVNGMTWTSYGSVGIGALKSFDGNIFRMDAGAYILSDQKINASEYTVSFTSINWYNTPARVMVAYQDDKNYYSFSPTTGQLWRVMNGEETELGTDNVTRLISSPRQNPSVNYYKVYFCNDGSSITISVDRDGFENRKDYEFTYTDQNSGAVALFKGGRIKLARVDEGTSHFWVNFDNILVTKGKLQSVLPRGPKKLYVSQSSGDDSYDGSEAKPFETISKAIESSYPGDEIIVEDGVYGDQIKFVSNRVYGEEGKRLVLRSRNRHKATVSGANLKYGDYVTMDGFEVIEKTVNMGGSTGAEVLNNFIHDVGMGITAKGINGRVAGNYILRISMGMNVSGSNMLVENNEIERLIWTSGDSDYFRFFGEGHIIRGNYMHGTRKEEVGKAHVDGFQTFDNNGEYARNIIIEGNFIEDFYHQGFMGEGKFYYHSYDITFRNNIFKDAAAWVMCISTLKDVKVYNNLFINMKQHGVGFRGTEEKPSTGEVRNNIFYNANYFGMDGYKYESGNNLLFFSDPYKKHNQDKFPNDIVNADPLFTDIDKNDFSLHPNSPAIDNGISQDFSHDFSGNKRPQGNGWDIGPYEYQGSSQPVACIQFSNVLNSTSGHEPFKVTFDGSNSYATEGTSIASYYWDFGDGGTGLGAVVNHAFAAGKHNVKLTVTDSKGNKHTAEKEFNVLPSEFPNLYLYLHFNRNCTDASGKNMTVASNENIRFENSSYGRSIRFDNNESRGISVNHNNYLDGLDQITIAFLAKKDLKDTAATVIHKHTVYGMNITANGFSGSISTDTESKKISAEKVVDDTDWHHYAITYDGSTIAAYLDGVECSRVECSGKIRRDANRAVVIGRNPWGDSFEGLIDEIRIYDRALSEGEIKKIMKSVADEVPTQTPTPTANPSQTQKQEPEQTPEEQSPKSSTSGGSGSSTTQKPAPSITPKPIEEQKSNDNPAESLITTDYPEMAALLELLYKDADIRDNTLNPTYGAMMKREPVITLTSEYKAQLKDLAKFTFHDIRGDEWYASYIPMAVYRKLIRGFPDGTFRGGNLISRAEVLTILARFNNSEDSIKQKAEQDLKSWISIAEQIGNDWYTNYVVVARNGLVYPDLYTSETIREPMTRGEVIYALANYLWGKEISEGGKYHTMALINEKPAFNDTLKTIAISNPDAGNNGKKSYTWYNGLMNAVKNPENGVPMDFYPAIMCLKDNGILLGNNGDSKWYDPITRAEVLALFERLAKVWGDESKQPNESLGQSH